MGLFQKALETYDHMAYLSGRETAGRETLAPIGHMIAKTQIEIVLDADGNFLQAQKTEQKIVIPVTEESSGRSNTPAAHGLCDQLGYVSDLVPEKHICYMSGLEKWISSSFSHPKIQAIYSYLKKNTVIPDLQKEEIIPEDRNELSKCEKMPVCWTIFGLGENSGPVWTDKTLMCAYTDYYMAMKENEEKCFCMLTGNIVPVATQHIKGIVSINGNAKIISSNDSSNFTYRGRFTTEGQALTIGYESSQKSHNALKWLVANYGEIIGGRAFVCWNPKGLYVPRPTAPFMKSVKKNPSMTDYKTELKQTLFGYKSGLPDQEEVVLASFDAATTGRLSVAYYNELQGSDFLERLRYWDETCCWFMPFYNEQIGKNDGLTLTSPALYNIVRFAFGVQRGDDENAKIECDDRLLKQQIQRLLSCRIDRALFPYDMMRALVIKAGNLRNYTKSNRRTLLYITCAVIRKYYIDRKKEELSVALEPEKKDRSYQFGRLLAILEKMEADTYTDEKRDTNAIRMQSVFVRRPAYATMIIMDRLKQAYYQKLPAGSKTYYEMLIGEVMEQISQFGDSEYAKPLGETYIPGYYLQKNALYTKKIKNESEDKEND